MAANDSLQYLSALQSIELRAYTPNENMLLEMVGGGTRTICWRAPGSHDLVIKDLTGDSKFCVGGTEIKNHPISVYYREGQTIGTIESNKLKLTGEDSTEDISTSVHQFTVAGNRIETFPTHITVSFNQQAAVELKASFIAFAIQQALAYNFLQRSLPVGQEKTTNVSNSSIKPKQNMQNIAVFNYEEENQKYYVNMAGPASGTQYSYILFWMDSSQRRNILLTAITDIKLMEVKNLMGELQFTVKMEKNSPISNVLVNSEQIGTIDLPSMSRQQRVITTNSSSSKSRMFVKEEEIVDSAGVVLTTFKKSDRISREVTFLKMAKDQKKVILAYFFLTMYRVVHCTKKLAELTVTRLRCNCTACQQPWKTTRGNDRFGVINNINVTPKLALSFAGHNSAKNLAYLNLSNADTLKTCLTLECTPVEKLQGLAQLVAKDAYGRVIFKAVVLPDDVLAIYSHKNKLLGYHYNGHTFDSQDNVTLTTTRLKNQNRERYVLKEEEQFEFKIFDTQTKILIANLQYQRISLGIYQPSLIREQNIFRTAMVISFGAKIFLAMYSTVLHAIPEISYRYIGSTNDASGLF